MLRTRLLEKNYRARMGILARKNINEPIEFIYNGNYTTEEISIFFEELEKLKQSGAMKMEAKKLYIKEMDAEENKLATLGRNVVEFNRQKNDVYGNPLYKVIPVSCNFVKYPGAHRNYKRSYNDSYYLLQSYNISESLKELLEFLDNEEPKAQGVDDLNEWRIIK